jgi:serine protease Do
MIKATFAKVFLVLGMACCLAPEVHAQRNVDNKYLRTNPKFIETFRDVVAKPSQSTVRVLCDDKDTALGMVVEPDGWILTKANDLRGKVKCKLKDGRVFDAKIVGIHKEHDLAMLKIDAKSLVPVVFTPSKTVDAGSWVVCAGLKAEPVAIGVVSVSTRTISKPGSIVTVDATKSAYLGVVLLEDDDGRVKITEVQKNSPADAAGLKADDIVVAMGGISIRDMDAFRQQVASNKPGDIVSLRIRRDGEELRIRATLGKQPAGNARGDTQNNMGSELSTRRTGYPTILQHDSVVKPVDCGGPIVDLDGHVIGINICRAGRTESWAVPSEVLLKVLPELKSGKLAPTDQPVAVEKKNRKLASATDKAKAIDKLLNLIKRRLDLSADVAHYKFVNKVPIEDLNREREHLTNLIEIAREQGLAEDLARDFVIAQLGASRQLQKDLHARWTKDEKSLPAADIPDLKKSLRPKIDKVSNELMDIFVTLQPYLKEAAVAELLRKRAAEILEGGAVSENVRVKALDGWVP